MPSEFPDASIERLADLFLEHPAWVSAASRLSTSAASNVYFSQRPQEVWRLEQRDGKTRLLPGAARDPDLVFRFTPAAIDELARVEGGIGEFAVALFGLMIDEDSERCVGFRVAAGFGRLVRRGYVRLLVDAGPAVAAFGAAHGITSLGALRRFVVGLMRRELERWETGVD